MKLFNKYKSEYITFIVRLINDLKLGPEGITKDEAGNMIKDFFGCEDEDTEEIMKLVFENTSLFKKKGELYFFRPFTRENDEDEISIPSVLNTNENRYLKTIMSDPLFRSLAGDKLYGKLENRLSDVKPYDWKNDFLFRPGIHASELLCNDKELSDKIALLAVCIRNNRIITYSNSTRNGVIKSIGYPYRIMYRSKTDLFQLLIYIAGNNGGRVILANINRLDDISPVKDENTINNFLRLFPELRDNKNTEEKVRSLESLAEKYMMTRKCSDAPLVLEAEEIFGSVERCFSLFMQYEKKAYYDEKTGIHRLEISYYDFDEEDIVRNILSLGDAVVVVSPERIRRRVTEEIKKAAKNYAV